jgi:hypothetical protein
MSLPLARAETCMPRIAFVAPTALLAASGAVVCSIACDSRVVAVKPQRTPHASMATQASRMNGGFFIIAPFSRMATPPPRARSEFANMRS